MSRALSGTHLCKEHQGNHSHYASENCELCKAQDQIERLQRACLGAIRYLGLVKDPSAHQAEVLLRAALAGKEEKG